MTVSYSISSPEPALPSSHLYNIARFQTPRGFLCVYWMRATRQVILHSAWDDAWHIQPDENIVASVARILNVSQVYFVMNQLFVFQNGHGKLADDTLNNSFYDCTWSDYACDHMGIEGTVEYPEYAVMGV
jgi:hypothetical protein